MTLALHKYYWSKLHILMYVLLIASSFVVKRPCKNSGMRKLIYFINLGYVNFTAYTWLKTVTKKFTTFTIICK